MNKKTEEKKNWSRFERAVDIAFKTPAKHKASSPKKPKKLAITKPR